VTIEKVKTGDSVLELEASIMSPNSQLKNIEDSLISSKQPFFDDGNTMNGISSRKNSRMSIIH